MYSLWPIAVIISYSLHAAISFYSKGRDGWGMFMLVWVTGACFPLWAWVSRYSKNLMFDGMVFDLLMFLSYAVTFMVLEKNYVKFGLTNYIGFVLVVAGMVMIKKQKVVL